MSDSTVKTSKPKITVFSNSELFLVLENHIPVVRNFQEHIRDVFEEIMQIDPEVMIETDKCLARNFKAAKADITRQINEFTHHQLAGVSFNELEFEHDKDYLFLHLSLAYTQSKLMTIFDEVCTSYEMPYQVVCNRIAGKTVLSQELQNLHRDHGFFVQALLRARQKHNEYVKALQSIMEHANQLESLMELSQETMSACTDMHDAILVLAHTHHRGMDFVLYYKAA